MREPTNEYITEVLAGQHPPEWKGADCAGAKGFIREAVTASLQWSEKVGVTEWTTLVREVSGVRHVAAAAGVNTLMDYTTTEVDMNLIRIMAKKPGTVWRTHKFLKELAK